MFLHPLLSLSLVFALWPFPAFSTPLEREDEEFKIFRRISQPILEEKTVTERILDATPQPFLDWSLVQPGFIDYLGDNGDIVPLNDEHPYHNPDQIKAVPFAIPIGIRIRISPPQIGGQFSEEILQPDQAWEDDGIKANTLLFDGIGGLYRLWYETRSGLAYAESQDLKTWRKPLSDLVAFGDHKKTNLIGVVGIEEALAGEFKSKDEANPGTSSSFFVDPSAPPNERYKTTFLAHAKRQNEDGTPREPDRPVSAMTGPGSTVMFGAVSPDGLQWRVLPKPLMYHDADTKTVPAFDPLLGRYVMYTRQYELSRRSIARSETRDFADWPIPQNILIAGPNDLPSQDFYATGFCTYPRNPEIRLLFCLVYNRALDCADIRLAVSRDGRVFHFLPGNPVFSHGGFGEPQAGFLSSIPNLVRAPDGRFMSLFVEWTVPHKFPRFRFQDSVQRVAWWKEDRLAGIEAEEYGEFTTIPFRLQGTKLNLNLASERTGGIQVEVRDEDFKPVPGRSFAEADTMFGDHTSLPVSWKGVEDLSQCQNKLVYFRFRLRAAKLFSISSTE